MANSHQGSFPGTAPVKPAPLGNGAREGSAATSREVAFTVMLVWLMTNYEDRTIEPTTGQMSPCSSRTGNTELQFIVTGTAKIPRYGSALGPR